MATTDSRTGFRLPWSTDRAASRDASAVSVDDLVAAAPVADVEDGAAPALEPGDMSPQDAAGDCVRGREEANVTIIAPDSAPTFAAAPPFAQADPPSPASEPAGTPDVAAAGEPATQGARPGAAPPRRPTKFLADLTRAMQAAAEQARTSTLDQFRGDGTAVIERIHARSATAATELRRHADDDIAAIKDWSKAEIARIRDDTERRIGARRGQLEDQLERHAALVEHEIEKVRGRTAAFETEMGQFFDDLVGEDDPAALATRAASLPEPPSFFENLEDDAMTALLREPGVGVPQAEVEIVEAPLEDAVEAVLVPPADAAIDVVVGDPQDGQDVVAEDAPPDREASMAAIQAAAEAAAALEPAEVTEEVPAAAAAALEPAEVTEEVPAAATAEEMDQAILEITPEGAPDVTATDPSNSALEEPEADPRLALLGLTPDYAAAEVAAVEMAEADLDDVLEIGSDALAARLSDLVPGDAPKADETTVTTKVAVTGLVSVASIASFKRHLGRLAGVGHVGVSSGPDAEFVFAVAHDPATSLRDLIPMIPGFAARVVRTAEGIIHVTAQDPQD
jgi:hypothetical protein